MRPYSRLADAAAREEKELARLLKLQPASAWQEEDATEQAREERRRTNEYFWEFDPRYFPPEVYKQGWAPSCQFHHDLISLFDIPGLHVVLGPRKHGKTVLSLKGFVQALVTGKWSYVGTWGSTLAKSKRLLRSIALLISRNPRLQHDYDIEIITNTEEEFRASIDGREILVQPYSPKRSVRGALDLFERPEAILSDDRQTRTTPFDEEANRVSRLKLEEAWKSCSDNAVVIDLGNNFDEDCSYNEYAKQYDESTLEPGRHVHIYPAWDDATGPLWAAKYPADSEDELRIQLQCSLEEWAGEFQQRPQPAGGYSFPEAFWREYFKDDLPDDAIGIAYNDPNLALKLKISDTTAMGALLYSPSTKLFYVYRPFCEAYSKSDALLTDYLKVYDPARVGVLAFDGNVDQEAAWTNNVENWCDKHGRPYPEIDYRRYTVDMHIKTVQTAYCEGRILFPDATQWRTQKEYERAKKQVTRFKTKARKGKAKIDFADWLVCAYLVLHDPEIALGEGHSREIKSYTYEEPIEF